MSDLGSKLGMTQRYQDEDDRRYDVDGGHGRYPRQDWVNAEPKDDRGQVVYAIRYDLVV